MPELYLKGLLWKLLVGALYSCLWMAGSAVLLQAQQNPAAREDAQIERQKILRAADQIEIINEQHNKLVEELDKLEGKIKALSAENEALSKQLAEVKGQVAKEREALLDQIAKLMADQEKRLNEKIQALASAAAQAPPKQESRPRQNTPAKQEEGYNHVVKSGQTLWSIAQAFNEQGVKVSVDEIRKANNLKEGQALRAGQKLFIPAK